MSDLLHEQLSALIDGELPAAETQLLLRRLEREPQLRARLASYRVCGETLRGGERVRVRSDFALRLSAVLVEEPCHVASAAPARAARTALKVLKPVAGLAVAAAVAGVAILVIGRPAAPGIAIQQARQLPLVVTEQPRLAQNAPRALPRGEAFSTEPASYTTPVQQRPSLATIPQAELTNYALAHSEVSGPLGLHSLLTSLVADEDAGAPAR